MANFHKKLEEASKKELYLWVNELDFRIVPLASDELTRRALNKLQETIKIFNKESSIQTRKMIRLTWVIAGLTAALFAGLVMQIWLALTQTAYTIKQTNYAAVQSIPERINQAKMKQEAIKRCKQSPELKESGLNNISTGAVASCAEVIEEYKIE